MEDPSQSPSKPMCRKKLFFLRWSQVVGDELPDEITPRDWDAMMLVNPG